MSTLFDPDIGTPIELAPPDVVRALVDAHGFNPEKVRRWSREKAQTVLDRCRKLHNADLNHIAAEASAEEQKTRDPRAQTGLEIVSRIDAAAYLEQARATRDAAELLLALTHAMHPLTTQELDDAAGLVIQQLRINPLTLERIPFGPIIAPPPEEPRRERA